MDAAEKLIMATNFDLAPAPVTFDGKVAVPVDISTINAQLRFDGSGGGAHGNATMSFIVGTDAGCPIFDLRQTITGVWLDGASLALSQVLTRNLGGEEGAELRVLDVPLAAGSSHTLRLAYDLGLPAASGRGSYPASLTWEGPRLTFIFGFTDLAPGRYLEAWVPANLIWDQYTVTIDVQVTGTTVTHLILTNGAVASLGTNHWCVTFPDRFTALSPLLEVRASDTIVLASEVAVLPISGRSITVEISKLASNKNIDLGVQLTHLVGWLRENEMTVGPYPHGDRFIAFLIRGGMEYEGACTASAGTLRHEAYHSWWGRGVKPASQADGWWDEGWNVYHDAGGAGTDPFDFTEAPILLSPRNGYARTTPDMAYTAGQRFFEGIAALTSPTALNNWMSEFARTNLARPVTTLDLEAHLVARSGQADLVDAFHRWVYGFSDPSPAPNLWLRDESGGSGAEAWGGRFWDSPDLWIRNRNDGGTVHQTPIVGRDNWFYARIRNRGESTARHFLVTFSVKQFAGMQFTWPADFLPAIAATGGFELAPGSERTVRARWPAALVPPVGTHSCWLAAVLARGDQPVAGTRVWEHGNLAQKNLTIVHLKPGTSLLLPFMIRGFAADEQRLFELVRAAGLKNIEAAIVPRLAKPILTPPSDIGRALERNQLIRSNTRSAFLNGNDAVGLATAGFALEGAQHFPAGPVGRLQLRVPLGLGVLGLHISLPENESVGNGEVLDLVQRDSTGRMLGGIAIALVS